MKCFKSDNTGNPRKNALSKIRPCAGSRKKSPKMRPWARFVYLRGDTCRECPQWSTHGPTIGGNHGFDYSRHKLKTLSGTWRSNERATYYFTKYCCVKWKCLNDVLYIHAQGGLQTPRLVIFDTETHHKFHLRLSLLAPPAEWQRNFSNADFHLKLDFSRTFKFGPFFTWMQFFFKICVITFSIFRHEASQWCTDKSWRWLNRTKCNFLRSKGSEEVQFCNFLTIFSKTVWNLSLLLCVYSFLLMILIICQELGLI